MFGYVRMLAYICHYTFLDNQLLDTFFPQREPPFWAVINLTPLLSIVEPKKKAASIVDSLPGNSLVSKTGYVTLGAGLATFLISKEIYVFNEETLVLVAFGGLAGALFKYLREPYNSMADEHINVSFLTCQYLQLVGCFSNYSFCI